MRAQSGGSSGDAIGTLHDTTHTCHANVIVTRVSGTEGAAESEPPPDMHATTRPPSPGMETRPPQPAEPQADEQGDTNSCSDNDTGTGVEYEPGEKPGHVECVVEDEPGLLLLLGLVATLPHLVTTMLIWYLMVALQ